jgi:hypothetical protein
MDEAELQGRQVQLEFTGVIDGFPILLPLLTSALLDLLAEGTRMIPIEGHRDGLRETGLLGIGVEHACPGDGLKESPVRAERQDQGGDDQCFAESM